MKEKAVLRRLLRKSLRYGQVEELLPAELHPKVQHVAKIVRVRCHGRPLDVKKVDPFRR